MANGDSPEYVEDFPEFYNYRKTLREFYGVDAQVEADTCDCGHHAFLRFTALSGPNEGLSVIITINGFLRSKVDYDIIRDLDKEIQNLRIMFDVPGSFVTTPILGTPHP